MPGRTFWTFLVLPPYVGIGCRSKRRENGNQACDEAFKVLLLKFCLHDVKPMILRAAQRNK